MRKVSTIFLGLMAAVLVGCGPTDATINANVNQKLASDDTVKSATIEASTQKKIVTLAGTVDSQETKDRAATIAHQADGVSDVVSLITVSPSGQGRGGPGAPGHGPGTMNNGMRNGGGMGAGMIGQAGGQGSGGKGGGQGSGASGQAGGQGSGGSTPPPNP